MKLIYNWYKKVLKLLALTSARVCKRSRPLGWVSAWYAKCVSLSSSSAAAAGVVNKCTGRWRAWCRWRGRAGTDARRALARCRRYAGGGFAARRELSATLDPQSRTHCTLHSPLLYSTLLVYRERCDFLDRLLSWAPDARLNSSPSPLWCINMRAGGGGRGRPRRITNLHQHKDAACVLPIQFIAYLLITAN